MDAGLQSADAFLPNEDPSAVMQSHIIRCRPSMKIKFKIALSPYEHEWFRTAYPGLSSEARNEFHRSVVLENLYSVQDGYVASVIGSHCTYSSTEWRHFLVHN